MKSPCFTRPEKEERTWWEPRPRKRLKKKHMKVRWKRPWVIWCENGRSHGKEFWLSENPTWRTYHSCCNLNDSECQAIPCYFSPCETNHSFNQPLVSAVCFNRPRCKPTRRAWAAAPGSWASGWSPRKSRRRLTRRDELLDVAVSYVVSFVWFFFLIIGRLMFKVLRLCVTLFWTLSISCCVIFGTFHNCLPYFSDLHDIFPVFFLALLWYCSW